MTIVSTLLCHRDVPMAVKCFTSFALAQPGVQLRIHDDGSLTSTDIETLHDQRFDVLEIVDRGEADDRLADLLRPYPCAAALRHTQPYALKLFDVPAFTDSVVNYVDSDVYFLRSATDLFRLPTGAASIFMRDSSSAYALYPWHAARIGARLPARVNSGLFAADKAQYDLDRIEWLLSKRFNEFTKLPWLEQTVWALLYGRAPMAQWATSNIAVVTSDLDLRRPSLVALHFVSPSRQRMAELPDSPSERTSHFDEAVTLEILSAPAAGFVGQSVELVRRRAKRFRGR